MKSIVYFMDFRATPKENLMRKLDRLLETSGLPNTFGKRDMVAVKLHFGESGNLAYIRPPYLRVIVEQIKKHGAYPFLTDANTLYAGTRSDAASHLVTAIKNGFDFAVTEAPVVIADGLRGKTEVPVTINRNRFKEVYIGAEIVHADALISVAHFKGHELSGFGGAIKNLGMGCASRRGKLAQHSTVSPKMKSKKCIGCGDCEDHCSQSAIAVADEKARIDPEKCIGCGECIIICPNGAVQIQWDQSIPVFLENMVEYAEGVIKDKKDRLLCVNFITDVSPACDCAPYNDAALVRNIGIVASKDPVAADKACLDLVNAEPALPGSCLDDHEAAAPNGDKFKGVYPKVDYHRQFEYAVQLGLGNPEYELVRI